MMLDKDKSGYRRRTQQQRHASFFDHTYPLVYKIALSFIVTIVHAILILVASVSIDTLP